MDIYTHIYVYNIYRERREIEREWERSTQGVRRTDRSTETQKAQDDIYKDKLQTDWTDVEIDRQPRFPRMRRTDRSSGRMHTQTVHTE